MIFGNPSSQASGSSNERDIKNYLSLTSDQVDNNSNQLVDVGKDDDCAQYAQALVELDPELSRRLLHKADFYVCSIMVWIYAIQYMDKTSDSGAAIMGLRADLNMHGSMYSWVGSAFYLGYLAFEIPVSLVLQKFPLAKTTGIFIILWGVVLCCSGACKNYAGFTSTRTLLGILEGAITPSFLMITSQWYKCDEQFSRINIWYAGTGIGTIIGSAIAYGLNKNGEGYDVQHWRILYITLGFMTILSGILFYFHIPDSPATAWFLDERERAGQVERIRDNKQGYGNHILKWDQVKEAFVDPHTYLNFVIVILANIPNGGITSYSTILYENLGISIEKTLLINLASGGVVFVGCTAVGVVSMHFFKTHRMVYANIAAILGVMALSIIAWVDTKSGKMAGAMLASWFMPVSYIALLSCITSNVAGSTKKTISGATLLIGYCVGNIIGPQTFKSSEAPKYHTAQVSMVACAAVNVGLYICLTYMNYAINRRRDRENTKLPSNIINSEFADLTDIQNPEFRYSL